VYVGTDKPVPLFFRIDVLVYDDYQTKYYPFYMKLWRCLADNNIQFLPHLGKYKPFGPFADPTQEPI